MARISLVITSYNQKELLAEAVDSGIAQSLTPHEIVIADDCSTDGSQLLIDHYARKFPDWIKPVYHSSNCGISKNRNSGILAATGDLITWLDGDDRLCSKKLENEHAILDQNSDVGWVYSQVRIIDEAGSFRGLRFETPLQGNIFEPMLGMLGSAPRCLMVRKDILTNIGGFDEDMTLYEDYDLCLRLAKEHECKFCNEPLSEYRVHPSGLHNADYDAHIRNLSRLDDHVDEMLSDYTETERVRLKTVFRDRADLLILHKASRQGDVTITSRHCLHMLMRSPGKISSSYLFRFMTRAVVSKFSQLRSVFNNRNARLHPR